MTTDDAELWALLRSLDDPEHLEFPAGVDRHDAMARFERLAERLDADFACRCTVDRGVQDASLRGRISIPAPATRTGARIDVAVSNFGGLAAFGVGHPRPVPGADPVPPPHERDDRLCRSALTDVGYTPVPTEPLWRPYRGPSGLTNNPTWWGRFFDYI